MSFLDDLNRAFTPEGREEAMQRAYETPADWDGRAPVAPAADVQQPSPATPTAPQEPEAPVAPQRPDPRFDQVRSMVQGVVQENQLLRTTLGQFSQTQQQRDEAEFAANVARLEQEGQTAEAIRLVQQRAYQREQTIAQNAQRAIQERDQALQRALVGGFTQEIIADHPDLTDIECQLLETIPDPDNRADWADYFQSQHDARKQDALSQGAAIHAASGVSRVGGNAPVGAAPSGERTGRESSYDIIRRTPWVSTQG